MSKPESPADMLSRLEQMAEGSPTWDLSEKDIAALRFILLGREKLLAACEECWRNRLIDPLKFREAHQRRPLTQAEERMVSTVEMVADAISIATGHIVNDQIDQRPPT